MLLRKRALPLFLAVAACHSGPALNQLPSFVVKGSIATRAYDGTSDDLLTGGLGTSGLANRSASGGSEMNASSAMVDGVPAVSRSTW